MGQLVLGWLSDDIYVGARQGKGRHSFSRRKILLQEGGGGGRRIFIMPIEGDSKLLALLAKQSRDRCLAPLLLEATTTGLCGLCQAPAPSLLLLLLVARMLVVEANSCVASLSLSDMCCSLSLFCLFPSTSSFLLLFPLELSSFWSGGNTLQTRNVIGRCAGE